MPKIRVNFEDVFKTTAKHLRVIIPDVVAERMGLAEGDEVVVEVKKDCIVVRRANRKLDEFIEGGA